jgi:hypothetical protein
MNQQKQQIQQLQEDKFYEKKITHVVNSVSVVIP